MKKKNISFKLKNICFNPNLNLDLDLQPIWWWLSGQSDRLSRDQHRHLPNSQRHFPNDFRQISNSFRFRSRKLVQNFWFYLYHEPWRKCESCYSHDISFCDVGCKAGGRQNVIFSRKMAFWPMKLGIRRMSVLVTWQVFPQPT